MKRLFFKLLKRLGLQYWGVAREAQLPPEFILTNHGAQRLNERLGTGFRKRYNEFIVSAYYEGTIPPPSFDPFKAKTSKPGAAYFDSFAYRHYAGKVWIYGLKYRTRLGYYQKHLITIYNWNEAQGENRERQPLS